MIEVPSYEEELLNCIRCWVFSLSVPIRTFTFRTHTRFVFRAWYPFVFASKAVKVR